MTNLQNERVLIVDDNPVICEILSESIAEFYDVFAVKSGEECLQASEIYQPDLVLLDIEMNGINGYETCRRLREKNPELPVIFLSGHDTLEERLEAFDSGGKDFIPKNTPNEIILRKVQVAFEAKKLRTELATEKGTFEKMAMTFLDSMGDGGVLLNYARAHLDCSDYAMLLEGTLQSIRHLGLESIIQIRYPGGLLSATHVGPAGPLDISILNQVSNSGRLFQFKKRLVTNKEFVTMIIMNMPDDPDLAGRVRDNIALLSDICNAFVIGITERKEKAVSTQTIREANLSARTEIVALREKYRKELVNIQLQLESMTREIEKVFFPLGLTNTQEEMISNTLTKNTNKVLQILNQHSDGLKSVCELL